MRPEQKEKIQIYTAGLVTIRPADEVTALKKRYKKEESKEKMECPLSGTRGIIDTFSKTARDNFKVTLEKSAPFIKYFITLNPHDAFFFGHKGAKDRIRHFHNLRKEVIAWLKKRNITGFVRVEYEVRNSGYYKSHVTPHMHIVVTKEFKKYTKEFKSFWLGSQKLDRYGHRFSEKASRSYDARIIKENTTRWIYYLCKSHNSQALLALDGYVIEKGKGKNKWKEYHAGFPIGRAWFKIGNPPLEPTPEIELTPAQGKEFRRFLKRYIAAQIKRYSNGKRTISKARKLTLGNQKNSANVSISKSNALKLLELAIEIAGTKKPSTRCALHGYHECQGWAADSQIFCPECLRELGKDSCESWIELYQMAEAA